MDCNTNNMIYFSVCKSGLYGKTNLEAAYIDQILDTVLDLINAIMPVFFEKDEAKKVNKQKWSRKMKETYILASAQSDQSLRWAHEETWHPWLFKMRPVKILIRLRVSKSVQRYVSLRKHAYSNI